MVPSVTFLAFTNKNHWDLSTTWTTFIKIWAYGLLFFQARRPTDSGSAPFVVKNRDDFLTKHQRGSWRPFFQWSSCFFDRVFGWGPTQPLPVFKPAACNPCFHSDSPQSTPGLNRVGQRSNTLRSRSKVMLSSILPSVEFAAGQKKLRWKLRPWKVTRNTPKRKPDPLLSTIFQGWMVKLQGSSRAFNTYRCLTFLKTGVLDSTMKTFIVSTWWFQHFVYRYINIYLLFCAHIEYIFVQMFEAPFGRESSMK